MKICVKKFFKIFASACLSLAAISAHAQTAREHFMLANSAYKNGDYAKAIEAYEAARLAGDDSAELYFNKGNAFVKLEKFGEAELNYMRSLYRKPRFREAAANLKLLINEKDIEPIKENHADSIVYEFSSSEWALLAFISFWTALTLLVIPPLYNKSHPAWTFMAVILFSILAASCYSLFRWSHFADTVVALEDDAPLRISPASSAPVSAMVSEGRRGRIVKINGNFVKVEMSNGKIGWADLRQISPVKPR